MKNLVVIFIFFQLERYPGERCNDNDDISVRYHDNDYWPAQNPMAIWFDNITGSYMQEWALRKEQLDNGEITCDEYFEWKINWPETAEEFPWGDPTVQWRKNPEK